MLLVKTLKCGFNLCRNPRNVCIPGPEPGEGLFKSCASETQYQNGRILATSYSSGKATDNGRSTFPFTATHSLAKMFKWNSAPLVVSCIRV